MTGMRQEIRFVRSADGTRIAWARHGHGPPLVRVATWMTHLEHDWESPVWRHWLADFGEHFTVIRYDDRGSGLSDRSPETISFDAWLADLEAVVSASGYGRFVLLGMSQAGAIAMAYAARHPERVRALVLYGAYVRGLLRREQTQEQAAMAEFMFKLTGIGWGRADPDFRRVFTSKFIPGGTEKQLRWFDEMQRISATPELAERMYRARATIDVSDLAGRIAAPTLVLQREDDAAVTFDSGRQLAALIPGARFVPLDGRNHILLEDEPAWPRFLDEVMSFAGGTAQDEPASAPVQPLSGREIEVLRLVARGRSNEEIAAELSLSVRTVERHLGNIYLKLGISGKSARAAAAARLPELVHERAAT